MSRAAAGAARMWRATPRCARPLACAPGPPQRRWCTFFDKRLEGEREDILGSLAALGGGARSRKLPRAPREASSSSTPPPQTRASSGLAQHPLNPDAARWGPPRPSRRRTDHERNDGGDTAAHASVLNSSEWGGFPPSDVLKDIPPHVVFRHFARLLRGSDDFYIKRGIAALMEYVAAQTSASRAGRLDAPSVRAVIGILCRCRHAKLAAQVMQDHLGDAGASDVQCLHAFLRFYAQKGDAKGFAAAFARVESLQRAAVREGRGVADGVLDPRSLDSTYRAALIFHASRRERVDAERYYTMIVHKTPGDLVRLVTAMPSFAEAVRALRGGIGTERMLRRADDRFWAGLAKTAVATGEVEAEGKIRAMAAASRSKLGKLTLTTFMRMYVEVGNVAAVDRLAGELADGGCEVDDAVVAVMLAAEGLRLDDALLALAPAKGGVKRQPRRGGRGTAASHGSLFPNDWDGGSGVFDDRSAGCAEDAPPAGKGERPPATPEDIVRSAEALFNQLVNDGGARGPTTWIAMASLYARVGSHRAAHALLDYARAMDVRVTEDFLHHVRAAYARAGVLTPEALKSADASRPQRRLPPWPQRQTSSLWRAHK